MKQEILKAAAKSGAKWSCTFGTSIALNSLIQKCEKLNPISDYSLSNLNEKQLIVKTFAVGISVAIISGVVGVLAESAVESLFDEFSKNIQE